MTRTQVGGTAVLLSLPWLNPFTYGPTSALVPWLVTLASVATLLGCLALPWPGRPHNRGDWARSIASAWLLAGAASTVIALIQYAGASASFSPWINFTEAGTAFANLRQRNQFATLTNIALASLLWWSASFPDHALPKKRQFGLCALAALIGLGNAASSSRTGLIQAVMLLCLVALWTGYRQVATRRLLVVFSLAYAAALYFLPRAIGLDPWSHGAWERFQAGDAECSSRITLWRNVIHLIDLRPWFGWGWGELDFAHFSTPYEGPRFCDILDNAHNLPLHLAVELGIPAALVICGAVAWLVMRAKPWRETDPTRQLAWTVLALIGLHSLLEYPLWYGPFQLAVGLCLVLLWPLTEPLSLQVRRWLGRAVAGLVTLLFSAMAYITWDYHRVSQIYLPADARAVAYRGDTLAKIHGSWLFSDQVKFAELTITPLTAQNADHIHALAEEILHFSPEPRVVEKLIESAVLLHLDDEARINLARFRAAFPEAHDRWAATQHLPY